MSEEYGTISGPGIRNWVLALVGPSTNNESLSDTVRDIAALAPTAWDVVSRYFDDPSQWQFQSVSWDRGMIHGVWTANLGEDEQSRVQIDFSFLAGDFNQDGWMNPSDLDLLALDAQAYVERIRVFSPIIMPSRDGTLHFESDDTTLYSSPLP